ncbi:hypothetical protein [Thalassobacillus sp. C254]|nr:hypothetical protein [Thalassobacillus sp. C254]
MNDFNVKTNLSESEINGLFQKVEQLKKERSGKKEIIDKKQTKSLATS